MGHYDNCREGYCAKCGAAPGNFVNGRCQFCYPPQPASQIETYAYGQCPTKKTRDQRVRESRASTAAHQARVSESAAVRRGNLVHHIVAMETDPTLGEVAAAVAFLLKELEN